MNFNDYVNQGLAFCEKKEYEPAIENFMAALKLKPDTLKIMELIWILKEE